MRFLLTMLLFVTLPVALLQATYAQTGRPEFSSDRLYKDTVVEVPFRTGEMNRAMNREIWRHTTEAVVGHRVIKEPIRKNQSHLYVYLPHPVREVSTKQVQVRKEVSYSTRYVATPRVGVR